MSNDKEFRVYCEVSGNEVSSKLIYFSSDSKKEKPFFGHNNELEVD
jgi:hypothetical protein